MVGTNGSFDPRTYYGFVPQKPHENPLTSDLKGVDIKGRKKLLQRAMFLGSKTASIHKGIQSLKVCGIEVRLFSKGSLKMKICYETLMFNKNLGSETTQQHQAPPCLCFLPGHGGAFHNLAHKVFVFCKENHKWLSCQRKVLKTILQDPGS